MSSILASASRMGFGTLLSRIFGLIREQVFAYYFGASSIMDAFQVAFRIPNLLRDLFAEGAMSSAWVPLFVQTRDLHGQDRAWVLARSVFWSLFLFVSILSFFGMVIAPWLVQVYAPQFSGEQKELCILLTRILFPFFPAVALAAAFMGVLNAYGVYFIPSFASAVFNITSVFIGVGLILSAQLFFPGSWVLTHSGIELMAIGVVCGGALQAMVQFPSLLKEGYPLMSWKGFKFPPFRDPLLVQLLSRMLPGTLGLAGTQLSILINTTLATGLGAGAVSYLSYAFRLLQFPIGLFGVSLASALLPQISSAWAKNQKELAFDQLSHALRLAMALNFPIMAILLSIGESLVRILFEYGRFQSHDTQVTAEVLGLYSLGLIGYASTKILVPACYSMGKTQVPVVASFSAVALSLVFNLSFTSSLGVHGLAIGTALGSSVNALVLFQVLKKESQKHGLEWNGWPLLLCFLKHSFLAFCLGCFLSLLSTSMHFEDHKFLHRWVKLMCLLGSGGILTLLIAFALRIEEWRWLLNFFFRTGQKRS